MDGQNMAGMSKQEIRERAGERQTGCLVAAACGAGMALLVLAWLVYLACCRWPELCGRLPPAGFTLLGVGLHMAWKEGGKGGGYGG